VAILEAEAEEAEEAEEILEDGEGEWGGFPALEDPAGL
jgi:hypothetical protein